MAMLNFALLILLSQPPTFTEVWNDLNANDQYPSDRLWRTFGSELTAELNRRGGNLDRERVERLKAKIASRLDPKEGEIRLVAYDPVEGMRNASFVTLFSADYGGETGCFVQGFGRLLIWKNKGVFDYTYVDPIADGRALEGHAVQIANRIVTAGYLASTGNRTMLGAEVFEKVGSDWIRSDFAFAEEEAVRSWNERIEVQDSKITVKMTVRLYPKHLDSPHAGPHVLKSSVWSLTNGKWIQGEWVNEETIVSVVDDLLSAVTEGRATDVQKLCVSNVIADEFQRLCDSRADSVHGARV
jgi:hypothetical protein